MGENAKRVWDGENLLKFVLWNKLKVWGHVHCTWLYYKNLSKCTKVDVQGGFFLGSGVPFFCQNICSRRNMWWMFTQETFVSPEEKSQCQGLKKRGTKWFLLGNLTLPQPPLDKHTSHLMQKTTNCAIFKRYLQFCWFYSRKLKSLPIVCSIQVVLSSLSFAGGLWFIWF